MTNLDAAQHAFTIQTQIIQIGALIYFVFTPVFGLWRQSRANRPDVRRYVRGESRRLAFAALELAAILVVPLVAFVGAVGELPRHDSIGEVGACLGLAGGFAIAHFLVRPARVDGKAAHA